MAGFERLRRKCSGRRTFRHISVVAGAVACLVVAEPLAAQQQPSALLPYTVVGDAIPAPLTGERGDPVRGRAIVSNRQVGLCILCHTGPFPEEKFQGTLAPELSGAGNRWTEGQLRLRIVDSTRVKADTIMPAYYNIEGLTRVAPAFAGKTVLSAEQIEDVVAYLATLRD